MQLRMQQELVKIGLDIKAPMLKLDIKAPQILMNTEPMKINMESPRPEMQLDQTQCWADRGHRNLEDFAAYCVELSQEAFHKNVDEIVSDGNRIAKLDGTTVASLAVESSGGDPVEMVVDAVPKHRPQVNWNISPVHYQVERGQVNLELDQGKVFNNFEMGYARAYILQQNSLSIDWVKDGNNTWIG